MPDMQLRQGPSDVAQEWQSGMSRFCDLPRNVEVEDRLRPRQFLHPAAPAPLACSASCQGRIGVPLMPQEVHVEAGCVRRPVMVKIIEEDIPVAGQGVPFEVRLRK
jgi:hypothetical protein